jgi:hypothetical protein
MTYVLMKPIQIKSSVLVEMEASSFLMLQVLHLLECLRNMLEKSLAVNGTTLTKEKY